MRVSEGTPFLLYTPPLPPPFLSLINYTLPLPLFSVPRLSYLPTLLYTRYLPSTSFVFIVYVDVIDFYSGCDDFSLLFLWYAVYFLWLVMDLWCNDASPSPSSDFFFFPSSDPPPLSPSPFLSQLSMSCVTFPVPFPAREMTAKLLFSLEKWRFCTWLSSYALPRLAQYQESHASSSSPQCLLFFAVLVWKINWWQSFYIL